MRRRLSGFSLLEVLLVVVLFAIAAGLAYRHTWRAAEKTKIEAAFRMLRLIDAAAKAYYRDNAAWPGNIQNLIDDGYIENPAQGQSDWTYSLNNAGAASASAQALRAGSGGCSGETLRRHYKYGFAQEGREIDGLTGNCL